MKPRSAATGKIAWKAAIDFFVLMSSPYSLSVLFRAKFLMRRLFTAAEYGATPRILFFCLRFILQNARPALIALGIERVAQTCFEVYIGYVRCLQYIYCLLKTIEHSNQCKKPFPRMHQRSHCYSTSGWCVFFAASRMWFDSLVNSC